MRLYTSALLTILLSVTACGGSGEDGSASVDAVALASGPASSASEMAPDLSDLGNPDEDSMPEEEQVDDKKPLKIDISTSRQAIDFMNSSPDADAYSQGILPKMAKENPDYAIRLLKNPHDYFIVVDKPSMFVVLYDKFGREKQSYKMACSKKYGTKHKRRDNRTPEGFFTAEGIYDSTDWLYTDDDGKTYPTKGQFGPRFIRLKTDVSRQIGIHGTCAPWALGRRASHGCIRIHNDNIMKLVEFVEVGTPIIVNPSDRDQKVNREEGFTVPSISIGKVKHQEKPKEEPEKAKKDTVKTESEKTDVPTAPDSAGHVKEPETIEADPDLLD